MTVGIWLGKNRKQKLRRRRSNLMLDGFLFINHDAHARMSSSSSRKEFLVYAYLKNSTSVLQKIIFSLKFLNYKMNDDTLLVFLLLIGLLQNTVEPLRKPLTKERSVRPKNPRAAKVEVFISRRRRLEQAKQIVMKVMLQPQLLCSHIRGRTTLTKDLLHNINMMSRRSIFPRS